MVEDAVPEEIWSMMKERLGYTDEELELFKGDPRNPRVLATGMEMAKKTIVFEVVESHGCNSQHRVGTRFFFTGDGNLITKMSPSRVCAFVMPVMSQAIFAIHELWYAGVSPNELRFRRGGCFDVGIRCGGWGHVVLEAKVMDREKASQLRT
jgi:uncharacterized repeat protein (TIGR04076 family)